MPAAGNSRSKPHNYWVQTDQYHHGSLFTGSIPWYSLSKIWRSQNEIQYIHTSFITPKQQNI